MRRCSLSTLLAVALVQLVLPAQLLAAPKSKVVVLTVQGDKVAKALRTKTTAALRDAFKKYPTVELLPTPEEDLLEVMLELECTDIDTECLSKMGKRYKADTLVYSEAKPKGGGASLAVRVVDVDKKKVVKKASKSSKKLPDVIDLAGPVTVALYGKPTGTTKVDKPVPDAKPAEVTLTANVEGADVFVDGKKLGTTPLTTKLKAGKHEVQIVKKGWLPLKRSIVVAEGKKFGLNFSLRPKPSTVVDGKKPDGKKKGVTEPEPAKPFYTTWWFWTAVGVGVAGIVTTAVLLSVDDEPAPTGAGNFGISAPDYDPLVRGIK